jgi:hypothetical protein
LKRPRRDFNGNSRRAIYSLMRTRYYDTHGKLPKPTCRAQAAKIQCDGKGISARAIRPLGPITTKTEKKLNLHKK